MTDGDAVRVDENEIDRDFNAASHFVDRHLNEGRGAKTAFIDAAGEHSYAELARGVDRVGGALLKAGLRREARIAMIMHDTIDFPMVFWGAIKAGVVPVAVNTLLAADHYRYILKDCRAQLLFVDRALYPVLEPVVAELPGLDRVVVVGHDDGTGLAAFLSDAPPHSRAADTTRDDACFWLYSSGSTGAPKGVVHRHANLYWTARLYGREVLGIRESDVVFSAAKLFFAYGLGNAMTFPMDVGATTVLLAQRPTPDAVMEVLKRRQPTVFYGVPTLYAALLADPGNDRARGSQRLRRCVSAGEALPRDVGREFEARFGAEVLDGVGSTEMLHIYLSNRPGDARYGCSGVAVPGYGLRLVDENGADVRQGEVGELLVKAPSACDGYFNQRERNRRTFIGPWAYSGDKYVRDRDGYYVYRGRSDDMFKSGGNWVSPFEVESALIAHDRVLEAAVIPKADAAGNAKPKAFVVLRDAPQDGEALAEALQEFVRGRLELWKYPRWIEFVDELPKTATGKIQRFRLRERESRSHDPG